MNLSQNNRTALRSLNILNLFLLVSHTVLLILFAALGIELMVGVNLVSILFYSSSFVVIKKEKVTLYFITMFLEIMIHMFLAVLCTGWNVGFQLYFIGCIAIVFYVDYFSGRLGKRHIKSRWFSVVSCILYLTSFLITRFFGALYNLGEGFELVALVLNSVMVFVFITLFFEILLKYAIFYEEEIGRQATHDKLTGMVNRHFLVQQLEDIYARQNISTYWLAILDIDNFKGINDKYGHLCGDFVLKTMAELIKQVCGERTVCRWGGEEFVIVGSDSDQDERNRSSSDILDEVRKCVAIKDFVYDEDTTVNLTVTIGAAHYQEDQTVDQWISTADARLYTGKQSGKNKVVESG